MNTWGNYVFILIFNFKNSKAETIFQRKLANPNPPSLVKGFHSDWTKSQVDGNSWFKNLETNCEFPGGFDTEIVTFPKFLSVIIKSTGSLGGKGFLTTN